MKHYATSGEIDYIRERLRYDRAGLAVGVNKATLSVYWALLVSGGSWNVLGLVELTGRSRSTVQRIIASGVRRGLMVEDGGKFRLSARGENAVLMLHRESLEIARGLRRGYSRETIGFFRQFGPGRVKKIAASISFRSEQ